MISLFGTVHISANAVANTISGIANIPGSTMGLAMILSSAAALAQETKQAKHYAKMFILMQCSVCSAPTPACFCDSLHCIGCSAFRILRSTCALPLCTGFLCSALSAGLPVYAAQRLRSGGDARYTMTVSIFSMWLFRVILSYIFVLKLNMGLTGVWFGMFIDWICRSVFFMIRFVSNKWMDHNVI